MFNTNPFVIDLNAHYGRTPALLRSPDLPERRAGKQEGKAFIKILFGVWGGAPIGFPEGEKPIPPGSGCDPTSLKWDGSYY